MLVVPLLLAHFLFSKYTSGAESSSAGNHFRLQLKAWVGRSPYPITRTPALPKPKHSEQTLKVRVLHQERHRANIEKNKSTEEIPFNEDTDENSFELVELQPPVVSERVVIADDVAAEPGQRRILAEVLDDSGRIGPMFEVRDEIRFIPPPPLPQRDITHAHFDTALLEKEIMIKVPLHTIKRIVHPKQSEAHKSTESTVSPDTAAVTSENTSEEMLMEKLREKLMNSNDYGSSFILPILSSVNYDNNTVPTAFSDIPVFVAVQLNILYLANFDSELMEFSIDVEMELSWFDLRLANNYTKPIRIREKQILDLIWKPDPYFVNSKFSHFHEVSFPNFRMRVFPDGLVKYTMRVTSVCNCFMLFCLYPHDRQMCDLRISSIAYPSSFVHFVWHSEPVMFQSEIALPELHVQQIRMERCHVEGKLIHSSCIRLVFELERDGGRFVVEKYIPSTLAMMFAWVAPYVPYNYEDVRIITPITVLLTLVQMEKGDKEIRTSYLTSMDIWFAAMKAFTALSLVESLIVLALIKRSRAMERNMQRAPNELQRANFQSEKYRLTRLYHRLDSISRLLSPVIFIMFFMYYVLFLAQGDDRGCVAK
ncbi:Neurotransmitter-gated ion-channel ligand binding domain protein [Necator americanus]|uniref:Neurotransmitter-gated ion-channel ligand binding domain protein n=1 Tax=Necator americanus TaxID=51031 RepID=W2TMI3_NECAM|nr:Neurotransmitter-gated ion-channel ligand binding domain protein [Necator americanus]ETN82978.1 Neurotransmitter-gated ion-channel ligand binding domain protein [Necator americanus]